MEILQRLDCLKETPASIRKYLDKQKKHLIHNEIKHDMEAWKGIQNIVVGNNSIACEAAASKAKELGYLPVIISTSMEGEAKDVGKLYARLAEFVMMCFDRKLSQDLNSEISRLELNLVAGGIPKKTLNLIEDTVDTAHNINCDIAIISGGQTTAHVEGKGEF